MTRRLAISADGPLRCPCDGRFLAEVWRYDRPPEGETRFAFSGESYKRTVERCALCRHFVSRHPFDAELYGQAYVDATYGDRLRENFDRIMALPDDKSDNAGRVRRIDAFVREQSSAGESVLDVGSGLCVFLARMKEHGFRGTALDPDPRAVDHARHVVGVDAVCADFMQAADLGTFDLVTFNKVLEHVADPVALLSRAREFVAGGGYVYVEVPDGEAAAMEGPGREEFFVEHLHIFSPSSLALLIDRAGFSVVRMERLQEPSTKFTIFAFMAAT
jgi:SAM-dependent methyltransferase